MAVKGSAVYVIEAKYF